MQPASGDPIRDYIRANLATHTREAIRSQLLAAGHAPERIDATWREEWQAVTVNRAATGLRWLSVALFVLGGLIGAFGALLILGFNRPTNGGQFLFLYGLSYLAIGYALVRLVPWSVRRFQLSGWWAALLGLALVPIYGAVMFGTCFATGSMAVAS